jgi:triacylglycerol lipase
MFLPPGFQKALAVEAADLALQSYAQYDAFTKGQPWAIAGNYQVLGLLQARPQEISFVTEPFGFVVRNLDSQNVFVALRGTNSFLDWVADFSFPQVPHPWGAVERGFNFIYAQCTDSVRAAVARAPGAPVFVTGHSLGAALAVLAAADIAMAGTTPQMYSFCGPRAGSTGFTGQFNQKIAAWRVVNTEDVVPTLPLATATLGAPSGIQETAVNRVLEFLSQLDYEHVGNAVTFTVQRGSIAGNHDLQLCRDMVNAAAQG